MVSSVESTCVTSHSAIPFLRTQPGLCAFSVVQVANIKKETDFKWYKDGSGVEVEELPDLQKGECHLSIPKVLYLLLNTNDSFCLTHHGFTSQSSKPAIMIF